MGYLSISLNHLQFPSLMFYNSQHISLSPLWRDLCLSILFTYLKYFSSEAAVTGSIFIDFWLCRVTCGILVPRSGAEPGAMADESVSSGLPGNSS